jgi:hypothetical protein
VDLEQRTGAPSRNAGLLSRLGVVATSALLAGWPLRIAVVARGETLDRAGHYGDGSLLVLTVAVCAVGTVLVVTGLVLAAAWRQAGGRDLALVMLVQIGYAFLSLYWLAYVMAHLSVDRGNESLLPLLDPTRW